MGVDRSVYLGPYLAYTVRVVKRRIDQCRDPEACPNPTEGYCPKCGVSVTNRFVNVEAEEPGFDVEEVTDGALTPACSVPGEHLPKGLQVHQTVPNVAREDPSRGLYFDACFKESAVNLPSLNAQEGLAWFKEEFAGAIKKIEDKVGTENVKICWGVLIYFW